MDDFFAVNASFPTCTRTDGFEPRIVPDLALWTHVKTTLTRPVRDLRSEGPPPTLTWRMPTDRTHVVHPRAAGLDVHKMESTATVRLCPPEGGEPETETLAFSTLESGMRDLVAWLPRRDGCRDGGDRLESSGAGRRRYLCRSGAARQARPKTDVAVWLARICQFGLATPSLVLPREFRRRRVLSRRRTTALDCATADPGP